MSPREDPARSGAAVELSVVVPVYGCRDCLAALQERLVAAIAPLTGDFELIFVDDRSTDGAWEALTELAAAQPRTRALRLSRNFGQHAAITAGLSESRGRWCVVLDCDLQDPPELIPELYAKAREGYDIVLARRLVRRQSLLRRAAAASYHRVYRTLVGGSMHTNYANLSIVSRKVVEAFRRLGDRDRQYLLILHWLGFERAEITIAPAAREHGRSSYDLAGLLKVAADGLFFQTTRLLRWVVYGGFVLAVLGVALAVYTMVTYALGNPLPDWTALPVLILVLTGFIIVSTGVTGLYVGKIFEQVKGRPLYVVDERVGHGARAGGEAAAPGLPDGTGETPPVGRPRPGRPRPGDVEESRQLSGD